jgi:hypothetical protein
LKIIFEYVIIRPLKRSEFMAIKKAAKKRGVSPIFLNGLYEKWEEI